MISPGTIDEFDEDLPLDYSDPDARISEVEGYLRVARSNEDAGTRSLMDPERHLDHITLIDSITLKESEYKTLGSEAKKKQIYLHDTLGWGDPVNIIHGWNKDGKRIGTAYLIAGRRVHPSHKHVDGQVYQIFSPEEGAWHLGGPRSLKLDTQEESNTLNLESIGIELCSWGPLLPLKDGSFVPQNFYKSNEADISKNLKIEERHVITYENGFRGFLHYERYTDAQLNALRHLLDYLCERFEIPRIYQGDEIFKVNAKALSGEPGIWTHASVRGQSTSGEFDKWDCHPQPELIEVLKS